MKTSPERQAQSHRDRRAFRMRNRSILRHLHGIDVVDRCKNCGGPIFLQSRNAKELAGRNVNGTPRHRHQRCPEVVR